MTAERKVVSFIKIAREDLVVATKLMDQHPRHCAFNIEQAAEKLLKAVLTVEGIHFSSSHHQLGTLAQLLPPDHVWRADLMAFDEFTSYATQFRYPTPGGGMPSEPEDADLERGLKEVLALVDEIADWCRERQDDQRVSRNRR
ncbi:MAG TPA: HEPN domain-containing protein [Skermanella sp.]|jgi:HEPN domain-containing protein|nr:HEPN domain-containing protein [Skermanella sp.]